MVMHMKKAKTRCKDPAEDFRVFPSGTIRSVKTNVSRSQKEFSII